LALNCGNRKDSFFSRCTQPFYLAQFEHIKKKGNVIDITAKGHKLLFKKFRVWLSFRML